MVRSSQAAPSRFTTITSPAFRKRNAVPADPPPRHGSAPGRQRAGRPVDKADLGGLTLFRQHDRGAPIVIAGADIGGDQPSAPALAGIDRLDRPAPAAPALIARQPVAQRALRGLLHRGSSEVRTHRPPE